MLTKTKISVLLFFTVIFLRPGDLPAHCDGMDGPVVRAAQKALETGDVNPVLIWVSEKDEPEIRQAFQKTFIVRRLSPESKELADRYFFETLVRLHREGEGAPYTGLKPAGRDLGPAIPAADQAIENRSFEPLSKLLTAAIQDGLRSHFQEVMEKKNFPANDLAAGRSYIKAYVEFIHYVERLYESALTPASGHYDESRER